MTLLRTRTEVKQDAISYLVQNEQLDALLAIASKWPNTETDTANILVDILDLRWAKVQQATRDAFLLHVLDMGSESLAQLALRVGVSWQPDKYRLHAIDSPSPSIRKWIDRLGKYTSKFRIILPLPGVLTKNSGSTERKGPRKLGKFGRGLLFYVGVV
jgi:hypothetical protein